MRDDDVASVAPTDPTESEPKAVEVVRDATFIRITADTFSSMFLGRDIEVAALVASPIVHVHEALIADGEITHKRTRAKSSFTEVGRLRMSPAGALDLINGLVHELVRHRQVDKSEFEAELGEAIAFAATVAVDSDEPLGGEELTES